MSKMRKLHSLNYVLKTVKKFVSIDVKKSTREVFIADAVNKFIAEDIKAVIDIPPFNRSVIDGYAVIHEDIADASPENPVTLIVKDRIDVGELKEVKLRKGEAVEVSTGANLPINASAVVPKENCIIEWNYVNIFKSVPPNYGISLRGEDLKSGQLIVSKGTLLRPWHIGLIASQGIKKVKVYEFNACVFSIGAEILDVGMPYKEGMIYPSTTYLLITYLKELGFKVNFLGFVEDDKDRISALLKKALDKYDFIFTTGGTSVGKKDVTVDAIKLLKPQILIHGFALTPGRPGAISVIKGKLLMALSGFPVAALAELEAVLKPLLKEIFGLKFFTPKVFGKILRRLSVSPDMTHLFRVKVIKKDHEYLVEPLRLTGSGILHTLVKGNGILLVSESSTGVEEGELVEVILIDNIED